MRLYTTWFEQLQSTASCTCGSIQTSEAEQSHLQVYLEVKHYQNDLHNNDINNYTGKGFGKMYNRYSIYMKRRLLSGKHGVFCTM